MKKKILVLLLAFLLIIPLGVSAKEKAKAKVKVYVFEAGGCPYCEAQLEYLKGLDSYNKKFTIVRKELYVDHVAWEIGRDFQLGKAVAEKFQKDGFEDASYEGTPFVVISNLYASASYSTNLESYINKAYKDGDKDVVGKIAKELGVENVDRTDIKSDEDSGSEDGGDGTVSEGEAPNVVVVLIGAAILIGAMVVVIKLGGNRGEETSEVREYEEETEEEDDEEEEVEEEPVRKPAPKTTPVKKAQTRKPQNKKTNKKTNRR